MELSNILELIHAVSDSNLTQFHLQEGNLNISMSAEKTIIQQAAANADVAAFAAQYQQTGQTNTQPSGQITAQLFGQPFGQQENGSRAGNDPINNATNNNITNNTINDAENIHTENHSAVSAGNIVKSPLVGTYYAASSPDSAPFVKVGDKVHKGQILGIVEAMKLMNEIESEFDGTVREILVENEQLVEFGQPMFVIE